ncbi:MAG: UDP-N-acetylmuramate dehydrogenase [Candidatus Pacebacteria bacterium]|nr:UDP-N-acetylmuramate dehydrogenase [Candidatus Paceibacterota bacterium]MBP9839508.1 UDP-N-acetylmuramate dehydrogenase [Candidatus Paceibacterota bacterium]
MKIEQNYDLTKINTFGIRAEAQFFVEINKEEEIYELFSTDEFKKNPKLFMGGGSNILFTDNFKGIVIQNKLKGIQTIKEDENNTWVRSLSGEVWHDLVLFAVEKNLWGVENLSLVPGTVGGTPMQNIGAYGVEVKETIDSVEVIDIDTGEKKTLSNQECNFGYRDSIFKKEAKGKYFIIAVTFKLSKVPKPNLSYKILSQYMEERNISPTIPKNISDSVSEIRRSKLPDPKLLGNAGSFFKNVFLDKDKLLTLRESYPDLPSFEEDGVIKVPSGWLIEKCGWKGKRVGNVGVHEKQALVLVNYGGATGKDILNLANSIIDSVKEKFNLVLTPEVNIV